MEVGEPTPLAVNWAITLADVTDPSEPVHQLFSEEEIAALRAAPAEVVVGNHVFHLLELAALHLSAEPVQLAAARLAIDAVQGIMSEVGDRLGENGPLLSEALSQIRLAYVAVAKESPAPQSERTE